MKTSILIIITALFSCTIFAQTFAILDTNNIAATVNSNGMLFSNPVPFASGFEVPKGSGKHTIFSNNIWIGAMNAGVLHVAAQTYAQSGNDFFYGPVASNYSAPAYTSKYNNVWKMSKAIIDYHKANYSKGGYVVPSSIANWPANGNTSNGEAARLAPYVDFNGNNTYDPVNGDYPFIRGDQAIFYITNDDRFVHTESDGLKLGIEVHGMVYSYSRPNDSALNQTVFVNFQIFNRSGSNYDSLYFGNWADTDLGNYADDYVGSDSLLNMFYTYNGNNNDAGSTGYGASPPAQGAVFLNHSISKFSYYDNDFSLRGNPQLPVNYYNYLKGVWKDNSQMTFGGNGYGGMTPANYMFSGMPELGTGWSEISSGNQPGDRRGVMSVGPYYLPAGGKLCIDIAFPFARDYAGTNLTSLALLRQRAASIQSFYNSQSYVCLFSQGINAKKTQNTRLEIYPNPAKEQLTVVRSLSTAQTNASFQINNVIGQTVLDGSLNEKETVINISSLAKGIYFIKVGDAVSKFVKE